MVQPPTQNFYEFGCFRIDRAERTLLRDREVVTLTQKAFDVLMALVERSGHIVEKEELMGKVWPDSFVEEGNLTQNIYTLRKILGETEDGQQYIQTVPRRGYRFTANVSRSHDDSGRAAALSSASRPEAAVEEGKSPASGEEPAAGLTTATPETFVGREPEMRSLQALLERALAGAGRIVFITGEPGQGKTSLAGEFVRRARQMHSEIICSRGQCVEQYGASEAYLPFLEAIGELLRGPSRELIQKTLRDCAPTWCLQFPSAFCEPETREQLLRETMGATKERMLREMSDCLGELATHAAVVLLVEDLHWADPSSIDLLRHLSNHIATQRLLLIGTFRPEDVEAHNHLLKSYKREMEAHDQCDEVVLGALRREHIAGYLDARFQPNDFPQELSELIQRKTRGHPLFATRLALYLAERGHISRVDSRWSLKRELSEMDMEVPESVLSMIRRRIEALDEMDRSALQYASVDGEEFLSLILAELLDADPLELEERLARLARVNRLIRTLGEEELPDGSLTTRYSFAHALYQNVLYGDMVAQRRRQLHRRAGELLERHYGTETPRIAAQLAMHFERGRDFERAVKHLVHAGDNATRLYANAEASEHYSRALKIVEKLHEGDEQSEMYLTLYHKRGTANLALGRFQQSVNDFTEMLEHARSLGSPLQESAALNALTMTLFYSHRLDEITARADEILRAAERAGSEALRIEAMQVIALKCLGDGDLAKARPMLDEVVQTARALNHQSVLLTGLGWRAITHFFQTEYALAEEMALEVQSLARELRDSFLLLEGYFVLGMVRGNQGRMSEALATFHEGIETAGRYGDRFWSPRMPNCIGWIYRELQDFDQALKYDRHGLEIGREANVLEAQANSLINLGIDHGRTGESENALEAFREVEKIFRSDAWFRWRYNIRLQAGACEHWLSQGDFAQAEEYARRLLETATHYAARKYIAVAHNLLAQIAIAREQFREAQAEMEKALAVLEKHPAPLVAWRVHASLCHLHLRQGKKQQAREACEEARRIIEQISSGIDDQRLRTTFLTSEAVRNVLDQAAE